MANLYQVILMAKDVAQMVEFYRDVVGLQVTYPADATDFTDEMWVTLDAGSATLAIHGGAEIQGSGSVQLSLQIDDVNAVYSDLKSRGVIVEAPRPVGPTVVSTKARDPEGNVLSFEQIKAAAETTA